MNAKTLVKTSLIRLFYKVLLMGIIMKMLVLMMSSCNSANSPEEPEPVAPCNTTATFRHNLCGVGVWGAYVLELNDGRILQPWSSNIDAKQVQPVPGMQVQIGYTVVPRDNRYDSIMTCMAIGPYRITDVVRIECLVNN